MTDKPPIFPVVSNHAMLRFLERVCGIDVESVRRRILTPTIAAAVKAGARRITVEGVRFVIKDGVIVTAWEGADRGRKRHKVRAGKPEGRKADAVREQMDEDEDGEA